MRRWSPLAKRIGGAFPAPPCLTVSGGKWPARPIDGGTNNIKAPNQFRVVVAPITSPAALNLWLLCVSVLSCRTNREEISDLLLNQLACQGAHNCRSGKQWKKNRSSSPRIPSASAPKTIMYAMATACFGWDRSLHCFALGHHLKAGAHACAYSFCMTQATQSGKCGNGAAPPQHLQLVATFAPEDGEALRLGLLAPRALLEEQFGDVTCESQCCGRSPGGPQLVSGCGGSLVVLVGDVNEGQDEGLACFVGRGLVTTPRRSSRTRIPKHTGRMLRCVPLV